MTERQQPSTDPRALQLAEARYRNGFGATSEDAWDTLDPVLRQHLVNEADAWLHAAVEAGIAPSATAPSDKHMAVYVVDDQFLYSDYPTPPPSDAVLRLLWAADMSESKQEIEDAGHDVRLIGWSQ